jgi:hypothetical protein
MRDAYRSRSSFRGLSPSTCATQTHYYDVLETQVMTLDEFLEEEDAMARHAEPTSGRPIPVLLLPGETKQKYEHEFESWLLRRNVTMGSLRSEPYVERRFRLDFADSRAWELRRRRIANGEIRRSRGELLAAEVISASALLKTNEFEGLNGDLRAGEKLRPIPIVLNREESLDEYEDNFRRWISFKQVTIDVLRHNAEEERRYRQCFAFIRASQQDRVSREALDRVERRRSRSLARSRTRSRSRKRSTPSDFLQCEYDESQKRTRVPSNNEVLSEEELPQDVRNSVTRPTVQEPKSLASEEIRHVDLFRFASEAVAKSVNGDATCLNKNLVETYKRMSNEIALNETAMLDAVAYVRDNELSKQEADDCTRQMDELEGIIHRERRRRDAALATIVAQEWKAKREDLEEMLEQPRGYGSVASSHEELVSMYGELERNEMAMQTQQVKLSNRLSWYKVRDAWSPTQLREVQLLTNALEKQLAERARLANRCQSVQIDLLRSNDEMRMLTAELIEEAERVWE